MQGRIAYARMRQLIYADIFGHMRYVPALTDKT